MVLRLYQLNYFFNILCIPITNIIGQDLFVKMITTIKINYLSFLANNSLSILLD